MGKQFKDVSARYGAPMGRASVGDIDITARSVRLFRVRLNGGGYDDGGAYWGHGSPLWCAEDKDGDHQFARAGSREAAALALGIPFVSLKKSLGSRGVSYGFAVLDGRAPMPEGVDREDVTAWVRESGQVAMGTMRAE